MSMRRRGQGSGLRVAVDVSPTGQAPTGVGVYAGALAQHLAAAGIEPVELMKDRPWLPSLVWLQASAARQVRRVRALLAHFTSGRAPVLGLAGIPLVLTVHDLTVLTRPDWYARRERLLAAPWLEAAVRRADAIIAVSHATRSAIETRFEGLTAPVHVVHHGVDERFRQAIPVDAVARWRLRRGLPDGYWLHVGAETRRKFLPELCDALAALCAQPGAVGTGRRPSLVLAGPAGNASADLARRIHDLGLAPRVVRLGYVDRDELPLLYAGARIVVAPSRHEGFGMAVLEAMAAGRPVVATNGGGLPEVCGDAAILVAPGDPEALAAALARLECDPSLRQRLEASAALRARGFSWTKCAVSTAAIYRSIAASPAAGRT